MNNICAIFMNDGGNSLHTATPVNNNVIIVKDMVFCLIAMFMNMNAIKIAKNNPPINPRYGCHTS